MNRPEEEFGATVRRTPPSTSSVLAPERLLGSGRYAGERRRSKERDQQPDRPRRARPPETARGVRRAAGRARSLLVVGGVTVAAVAVAAAAVVALNGGEDQAPGAASAPSTLRSAPRGSAPSVATTSVSEPASTPPASSAAATSATSATTVTSAPATTTPVGTTTSVVPATPENVIAYEGWSGTYAVSSTVVDGNPNFPVGMSSSFDLTFNGTCSASTCSLSSPQFYDQPWIVQGDRLTFEYDTTEPCPDGTGTARTRVTAGFNVTSSDPAGRPVSVTGSVRVETVDAATACAAVTSDPVTYDYALQRSG